MQKETVHIVKIGGKLINDASLCNAFLDRFSKIEGSKILIHGGGRMATTIATKLQVKTTIVDGRRVTDEEMLDVAVMVYSGLINKNIVASLQKRSVNALGLSGTDADLIRSHKRIKKDIDYGFVGDIDSVNHDFLSTLLRANIIPVICAITHDGKGQLLNTNADTISAEIAKVLTVHYKTHLSYCFEYPGVMRDIDNIESTIHRLNFREFTRMQMEGLIHSGMIPKLSNGFMALKSNVTVNICGIYNLENKEDSTILEK